MNLENHFLKIQYFLQKHILLVENEVLLSYKGLPETYKSWADEVNLLNDTKLALLENDLVTFPKISNEFKEFIEEIKALSKLPKFQGSPNVIPKKLNKKLSLKKQHEISLIDSFLKDKKENLNIIDIGSGAGHLSSILLWNNTNTSTCIDMNKNFQEIGKKKLKRDAPEILERLTFKTAKIEKGFSLQGGPNKTLLGLHTCGDLAVDLIKVLDESNNLSFLNFGCCYHKLSKSNTNISECSKNDNTIELSQYPLTMAAKSFKSITTEELTKRRLVKNYRYTLHLFLENHLKKSFEGLGNASSSDYKGPFSLYAKKYVKQLESYSNNELDLFYENQLSEVTFIQSLGVVRGLLARLVEIYIILDRAIYLKEHGHKVEVLEFFNKELSPRNIGIWIES